MRAGGRAAFRPGAAVVLLALVVLLGGCRADIDVAVEIDAAGAGLIAVTVRLDQAAAAQVPDLASLLDLDDLRAAGWRIEGPAAVPDGAVVRAEKTVDGLGEARVALAELSGPTGPLASLRLEQGRTLVGARTTLSGRVELMGGLAGFSDPELQARLGDLPLGVDAAQLERELGRPLADVLGFRLHADLPGRSATVQARLGESVPVDISGHRVDRRRVALSALSAVTAVALLAVLARRLRPRGRHTAR